MTASAGRPLLEVRDVRTGFGSTTVLHGLSYTVGEGEIAGIFGLNGAGKSVSMKALAGIVPVWSGSISFDGQDITNVPAERRVALGMGHVPQGRQVFPALTVEENLRLGAYTLRRRRRDRYAAALASVYDRFPVLAERRNQPAGTMSGGQQASLAVARALVNEPRLILVDEPSAGLSPVAVHDLYAVLRDVAATGVTMVLVEQNVTFGLRLADTAHILQVGRIVYSGAVDSLDHDALVRHLGIGRMLEATTSSALAGRHEPVGASATGEHRNGNGHGPERAPDRAVRTRRERPLRVTPPDGQATAAAPRRAHGKPKPAPATNSPGGERTAPKPRASAAAAKPSAAKPAPPERAPGKRAAAERAAPTKAKATKKATTKAAATKKATTKAAATKVATKRAAPRPEG